MNPASSTQCRRRPAPGSRNVRKIYAESFRGADHLRLIAEEEQTIVNNAIAPAAKL